MRVFHNISAQKISWVKSNRVALDNSTCIKNLYYPDSVSELSCLLSMLCMGGVVVIGYSSNTLYLPSFKADNVVCTKYINQWTETNDTLICDCGVSVSSLSKYAVEKGYKGFEGLTDLPGTIASAVYGNSGCRGCSVNALVKSFSLFDDKGQVKEYSAKDLKVSYRSTSLKRGELKGTILQVTLTKIQGNPIELKRIADHNHVIRKAQQPSVLNNLGTTINGGNSPTCKGRFLHYLERIIQFVTRNNDTRNSYPLLLKLIGKRKYVPYVYYWNRYMFLDEKSHMLFDDYVSFVKTLYSDAKLEIEIRS